MPNGDVGLDVRGMILFVLFESVPGSAQTPELEEVSERIRARGDEVILVGLAAPASLEEASEVILSHFNIAAAEHEMFVLMKDVSPGQMGDFPMAGLVKVLQATLLPKNASS